MKKMFFLMGLLLLSSPIIVHGEELKCEYHYYHSGNSLGQTAEARDFEAMCTFTFKNDKISKHSCTMNYYFNGKSKNKKLKLTNFSFKGQNSAQSGMLTYTKDYQSAENVIASTKKCPDYVVNYYDIQKGVFGGDKTSVMLYAAQDEEQAKQIHNTLTNAFSPSNYILKNKNIGTDPEETEQAYKKIEEWIQVLENEIENGKFDFTECADSEKVVTKYKSCETLINNKRLAITNIEKDFLNYINNHIVAENDRTAKMKELLAIIKNYINQIEYNMDALDCELKLELGLVKRCDTKPSQVIKPDKNFDFSTKPKQCTSCGNGALTDIPAQLPTFTRNLVFLIQLLIPLALIALGIYDFIRAIIASDDKLMQESQKRFVRRIIAGVLIFFVIAIVKLIFGLIPGNVNTLGCVPCFTSDASSCGETYTCNY